VASFGDVNFNGAIDPGEGITLEDQQYTLLIGGAGDVALGGVVADGAIYTQDFFTSGFEVDRGDIGGLHADVRIFSDSLPYEVFDGNLRVMDSKSIGFTFAAFAGQGPALHTSGSIGLVRATGPSQPAAPATALISIPILSWSILLPAIPYLGHRPAWTIRSWTRKTRS
jgi:hypothetical protein